MTLRFRTQLFLAAFGAAAVAVVAAMWLVSHSLRTHLRAQIERTLVGDARLAAELLSRHGEVPPDGFDAEADAIGALLGARVTLIGHDGRVIGDSAVDGAALDALDDHGHRPEVVAARATGLGVAERYSTTVGTPLLYVAVPTRAGPAAFVRVALPLTEVRAHLAVVWRLGLLALGVALGVALAAAGAGSALVGRRVSAIARAAERYAAGQAPPGRSDASARDELDIVARALDAAAHQVRRQIAELTRGQARLEAILSGLAEGVLVTDAAGRIELANDAARHMLGLADPAVGRHIVEVVRHPDVAAILRQALAGHPTPGVELSVPQAPGRTFLARGAPVTDEAGHGALVVWHDITDLRRTDQIRRDFVANVSHELRTPLTAIRGAVEALAETAVSVDQVRFLDMIARHAHRMERLVHDLLRLERLDAGQETLEAGPCALADVVAGVESELQPLLAHKRQRLVLDLAPDADTLTADAAKLHDILRNLVENAAQYSPGATTITVGARHDDGTVVLTVADEGPGIPEPDLARVFERFYRVDRARSREAGGTGLGLAIVKHLVGLHGGTVEAANRPQGGAVFSVRLPDRRVAEGP